MAEFLSLQLPRLEEMEDVRCLVLLGEPGTGKSSEIARVRTTGPADAVFLDLSAYDGLPELRRDLFDRQSVREWAEGEGTLTLYLDSLDEALLEVRSLSRWLVTELGNLPTSRMRIRIASRTADWPPFLEGQLRMIFGDDSVGVYEIAPLRTADVAEAATVRGLEAASFITEVRRKNAGALASKPLTLNFLLNLVATRGGFPTSRVELFRDGCLQLCEEQNLERRASRRGGQFSASQRLAAASRIAAVTIFGNRAAVWTGVDSGNVPSTDVPRSKLAGGTELHGGQSVDVDEHVLDEALGTGLFSSRGEQRLGWAHQTYAEYLAARWVAEHRMPIPQIEALVRHTEDPGGRIVPQLAETVAWLCGMDPRVRTLVLDVEPEILLRSDVEQASDAERARIVDTLLRRAAGGELQRPPFGTVPPYEQLAHPGLDVQLRSAITDRSLPEGARELAIRIARSTQLLAVQGELADLALDPAEPIELRTTATVELAKIGDPLTRRRLLPLATDPQPADANDDLKGYALQATWPDHLSTEQLFSALTPPKRPSWYGGYMGFFDRLAAGAEAFVPLSAAVAWVRRTNWIHGMARVLPEAILLAAWNHLDQPNVLDAFAEVAADSMKHYRKLIDFNDSLEAEFERAVETEPEKRRLVLERIMRRWDDHSEPHDHVSFLLHGWNPPLVRAEDFEWVLGQVLRREEDAHRWLQLLASLFTPEDARHVEVIHPHLEHPLIGPALSHWFNAVPLDALRVDETRRVRRRMERLQARQRQRAEATRPSAAVIREALGRVQGGEEFAWVDLVRELSRSDPEAGSDGESAHPDLRRLPLWRELDEADRAAIRTAAERYVLMCDPRPEGHAVWSHRVWEGWAGYRALRLVEAEAPDRLSQLTRESWERWAPVVVAVREWEPESDGQPGPAPLLSRAYAAVPDVIAIAARELLRAENAAFRTLPSAKNLRPIYDAHLHAVLVELIHDDALTDSSLGKLLRLLLARDVPEARNWAAAMLRPPLPRTRAGRERALVVARALLVCAPDGGWPILWPLVRRRTTFSRDVALSAADLMVSMASLGRFDETQLAEMFRWLVRHFPYAEDPYYPGVHHVTAADDARHWRGNVIKALVERATPQSVREIAALRIELPHLDWLSDTLLNAREAMRRERWESLDPEQIVALGRDPRVRVVEDGDHLLKLLRESLARFEEELHGETAAVETLWDERESGRFRPKNEAHLSNAIARHLRRELTDRGVVVGREVEIRQTRRRVGGGQTTDIHVDAVREHPTGSHDVVSAIVEVKGSWNPDVLTAMRTQLAGSYLARNPQVLHGLYVVGWYLSDRWMEEDGKRRTRNLGTLHQLRTQLEEQAANLSHGVIEVQAYVLDASWR